jgi:predicted DNA-binding transcriptional regulator AlpA
MISEEKIYLSGITKEQLAELVASEITQRFQSIAGASAIDDKKPMDIHGAPDFAGIAVQTIYKGTSDGSFPHHKQGGKLFFFRDEIIAWIKNKRQSANPLHLR